MSSEHGEVRPSWSLFWVKASARIPPGVAIMDFQYRSLHSVLGCDTKVEIFPGNSSIWCLNPYSNDEVKDIENLWLRHQAEFLLFLPHPSLSFFSLSLSLTPFLS